MNNEIKIKGIPYKIGAHNLVFWKPAKEWLKSTKSKEDIEKIIDMRKKNNTYYQVG
jgi:hypothetical protein